MRRYGNNVVELWLQEELADARQAADDVYAWLVGRSDARSGESETAEAVESPELAENLRIWRTRVRTVPSLLSSSQVQTAVANNRTLGASLGWNVLYDAIAGWIFRLDMSPTEATFAQFVADWQRRSSLPINGELDYGTWSGMLRQVKRGIPATFTTIEGVTRPHGLNDVVATFGDPTQRNWEGANIVRVNAPAGREFQPGRTFQRVHRLLQPHFARLFADVGSTGVWNDMVPTSGTFYCRTKSSYGKKVCGTPGIQFNQLSTHSWGITIDVNAGIYPRIAGPARTFRYPPATLTRVFQAHGFHWGLWFMDGSRLRNGRINFAGADPHHFQFATGY